MTSHDIDSIRYATARAVNWRVWLVLGVILLGIIAVGRLQYAQAKTERLDQLAVDMFDFEERG